MDYKIAVDYLKKLDVKGMVLGLENMKMLLYFLGNPQNNVPSIHIAGTNGKGSVGTFISEILINAGYNVGRYVSPAVIDIRECWQLNGKFINESDFAKCVEIVKNAAEKLYNKTSIYPTRFEIETCVAFLYFKNKKCDISIIEVGLGGRNDATNITENIILSVITSISIDHINILGNNLYDIAKEKAGIIKKGILCISAQQKADAEIALKEEANKNNSEILFLNKKDIINYKLYKNKQYFDYGDYENLCISMLGLYQIENAALAVKVCDLINKYNFKVNKDNIRKGLLNSAWPGRFQILKNKPTFIVDGAHNADAAKKLMESTKSYLKNKKLIFIIGMFADKEYEKVAKITAYKAEKIIIVECNNKRTASADTLLRVYKKYNENTFKAENIKNAVFKAIELAGNDNAILAFGSLSYLGELIKCVNNIGRTDK